MTLWLTAQLAHKCFFTSSLPENNMTSRQNSCDLVNVEGNIAEGKSHNTLSLIP